MHPQKFAICSIEGHDVAASSGYAVHHSAHHERRRFQIEFRPRTEISRAESPSHLQLVEVGRIDLVKRRITRVAEIAPISPPFPILRARLRAKKPRTQQTYPDQFRHQLLRSLVPTWSR